MREKVFDLAVPGRGYIRVERTEDDRELFIKADIGLPLQSVIALYRALIRWVVQDAK